jgi:hypothetical protein
LARNRDQLPGLTAGARQQLGEPPVHDLDLAELPDHHVGWLQVPVNDPLAVGVAHRLADLLEDPQETVAVLPGVGSLRQQSGERLALDQLHGDVRPLVEAKAEIVDRHDTGVLRGTGDLRFLDEALPQVCLGLVIVQEHLDRHVAGEVSVPRLEDHSHAAAADLTKEFVASLEQGRVDRPPRLPCRQ